MTSSCNISASEPGHDLFSSHSRLPTRHVHCSL